MNIKQMYNYKNQFTEQTQISFLLASFSSEGKNPSETLTLHMLPMQQQNLVVVLLTAFGGRLLEMQAPSLQSNSAALQQPYKKKNIN